MSSSVLVDGRVLDDHYPGVRRFWVPILSAWAARGGKGLVAHRRGKAPEPELIAAGFSPIEVPRAADDPLGWPSARRVVRQSAARVTLSPLYLTLDGAQLNVATVFDLIGRTHPRSLRSRLVWELTMRRTVRAASRILCASAAIGSELVEMFPRLSDRIALVSPVASGEAGAAREQGAGPRLGEPYALVVASHRPHKRLAALVAAWRAGGSTMPLVMVGHGTEHLNAPPLIRGLGFVSDAAVDTWLAGAACVVSASLAEGFGLSIFTALAAGVPVVATRHPVLEGVAGDAVTWLEPEDVAGLVRAAHAALADGAAASARAQRGRERAQTFTATRAAQQLERALQ